MNKLIYKLILAIVSLGITVAFAAPESLGREKAWEAVKDTEKNLCYMISFPLSSEGNYTVRDPAYLTVSIRPNDNIVGEISFYAGYPYGNKPVEINVDGKTHEFIARGEWAWAKNAQNNDELLKNMIAGNRLIVKGYSQRGTLTTDTFSLNGVTNSWNKAKAACGQ